MTADTPSPSEVVEKLTALRVMCESCNQPLYVEILDEVLSALSSPRSSTVDEATVEAVARAIDPAAWRIADDVGGYHKAHGIKLALDYSIKRARAAITSLPSVAVQPVRPS